MHNNEIFYVHPEATTDNISNKNAFQKDAYQPPAHSPREGGVVKGGGVLLSTPLPPPVQ